MEFKVFEDKSGAFVFNAPGSKETADRFELLVEAFVDGRIHQKRMASICENMMRDFPPLLRPYHILATIHLSKGKHAKALNTALRGLGAVNEMFPDDFCGPIPWHHDGNRPYLDLLKTILLCHIASRDFGKAAEWCGIVQRADPDDSCGVRFVMGHALLRSGEQEKAQAWFVDHGTEYAPYYYELGLCHLRDEQYVQAATAFRRGIAINPYIAEMIFNGHVPNPYAVMHFWANEMPPLAKQYLGSYADLWEEALVEQRFLYWVFNHSLVLQERARLMACRERRSINTSLPQPKEQVAEYRALIESIDDRLSFEIVRRRPNGDGAMEWPWEVYN
ncbi:tetratricopeptide repeat protein [Pseudoduganella sp.]|uniref:tetratricopeptide repeat protein n=1 Tax=Pseudoduganella sp. TaxID=1880898 RepID=UPI0035AE8B11